MNIFNKTLIAAAITGLVAAPAINADTYVPSAVYSKVSTGSVKFSGQRCKTLKYKDLDATLYISGGFEGFEGFEGGPNTSLFFFSMFAFGDSVDGEGPLVASNKLRTYNMDVTYDGYADLEDLLDDYLIADLEGTDSKDGCKTPDGFNYGSLMIDKFETKISKNGSTAKLKMDAQGTYYDDDKDDDKKVQIKVKANMDLQNPS